MLDRAGPDLVEPDQTRQDGQAGRVGRRPTIRPQVVTGKVEDGSGARLPRTVRLPLGIEHLVEDTIVHVHGEHVTVAARRHTSRWSTLDRGVRGYGIRARVALVVVVERHVDSRLARVHGDVRDPDGRALPESRPEVRVHG